MVYDNTNRGAMWPNVDRATEKHPDFKGSINVEGKEYWLSGWKKKDGAKPLAPVVTFRLEEKQRSYTINEEMAAPVDYDLNDDLPF